MAVLAEQITCFIKLTDFSTLLSLIVMLPLLLLLLPANSPRVGIT